MSLYRGRELSAHMHALLKGASEEDTIILTCQNWLNQCGVTLIKQRTDLSTNRTTMHFRSMNVESAKTIKAVLIEQYAAAYAVEAMAFMQSLNERKASQEDCMYFHVIVQICDYSERKSADDLKRAHSVE